MLKMIGVKLTSAEQQLLDEIVVWCDFHSRSDAIRIALLHYAEHRQLLGVSVAAVRRDREEHPIRRRPKESTESYLLTHKTEKKVRKKNG